MCAIANITNLTERERVLLAALRDLIALLDLTGGGTRKDHTRNWRYLKAQAAIKQITTGGTQS